MQWLPLSRHSAQTSPGTTRFFLSIHPLHLPYMIPCSYRASACKAVLPSCMAFYVISVRQTGDLPVVSLFPHPASFRFHLAMDTLTFGYILPTTGRIRDLHPLETCAAGRTIIKKPPHLHDLPERKSCSVRRFFAWLRVNTEKQERLPFLIMNYLLVRLTAPKKLRTSYLYCPCIRIAHESKLSTQFYHQVSAIQRLFTFSSQEHPQMPR